MNQPITCTCPCHDGYEPMCNCCARKGETRPAAAKDSGATVGWIRADRTAGALYQQLLNTIGATDQVGAMRELARLHALDISAQPPAPGVVSDAMVQRFLAWELLTDARQQSGGPGTVNADEARTLLHHVLFGVPAAQPSADDAPYSFSAKVATQVYDALLSTIAAIRAAGVLQHRDYDRIGIKANDAILAFQYERDRKLAAPPADARDADTKRLDYIASEYLEITPFAMPTPGGEDADVGWRVYDFYQAPPEKRLVAEVFRDNLREAIDAARSAGRAMGGE